MKMGAHLSNASAGDLGQNRSARRSRRNRVVDDVGWPKARVLEARLKPRQPLDGLDRRVLAVEGLAPVVLLLGVEYDEQYRRMPGGERSGPGAGPVETERGLADRGMGHGRSKPREGGSNAAVRTATLSQCAAKPLLPQPARTCAFYSFPADPSAHLTRPVDQTAEAARPAPPRVTGRCRHGPAASRVASTARR